MRVAALLVAALVAGCGAESMNAGGGDDTPGAPPDGGPVADAPSGGGACPWGAQLADNAGVGLAAVAHTASPTAEEQQVFAAMNARRSGAPLVWNGCLTDLARSHSVDMVTRGYYGHGSKAEPRRFMIGDRVAAAGLALNGHADEDLLTGDLRYFLGSDITNVVAKWMTDGHALPILNCAEVGVGISSMPYMDTTIVWVTADFACP